MVYLQSLFDSRSAVRPRALALSGGLLISNLVLWLLAAWGFSGHADLWNAGLLAYGLGIRHAVDPDHIAAIDNVTRQQLQQGRKPVSLGLWFALGHSTIVVVAACAIAYGASGMKGWLEGNSSVTDIVGTIISSSFLLLIGLLNLSVLRDLWRLRHALGKKDQRVQAMEQLAERRTPFVSFLKPVFSCVAKPWHMYPVGFLFALGFDTATEIGLFALAAVESSHGLDSMTILMFPLLFTAGMSLIDAADGLLMLGAYGWAFVDPERKLAYNLAVTLLSVGLAITIAIIELLSLVHEHLHLEGLFWDGVEVANQWMSYAGMAAIMLFLAALAASLYYTHRKAALLQNGAPGT